jgi:hypothetical protein
MFWLGQLHRHVHAVGVGCMVWLYLHVTECVVASCLQLLHTSARTTRSEMKALNTNCV